MSIRIRGMPASGGIRVGRFHRGKSHISSRWSPAIVKVLAHGDVYTIEVPPPTGVWQMSLGS